jgi:hypothetical protein
VRRYAISVIRVPWEKSSEVSGDCRVPHPRHLALGGQGVEAFCRVSGRHESLHGHASEYASRMCHTIIKWRMLDRRRSRPGRAAGWPASPVRGENDITEEMYIPHQRELLVNSILWFKYM